jgi:pyruvate/2-oxoglutarate dehydrogenase complex dihydrolipoamide dehydrogenase (E3) component
MTTMTTSIRTPFDFSSTADDVIDGIDLSGRRAIVTGGSSGIGVETARALASVGAEVTLAIRRTAAGDHVAAELVGLRPPSCWPPPRC